MSVHAITSYYNPCHWRLRRQHYDTFAAGLRAQKVPLLTVEMAVGDDPFELPPGPGIIQIRTDTLLWQKERLLGLTSRWLPKGVDIVAWLDCDILFDNPTWAKELACVMRTHPVAQVWTTADRLDRHGHSISDFAESFASVMKKEPGALSHDRYDRHGHTGYGWAMRRGLFDEVGLYEAAVVGSADHFMAHACFGHYGFCIENALKGDERQISHLKEWGERFYAVVQGRLGVVSGNIRHLWHGDAKDRRYFLRMHDVTNLGFDPWTDLRDVPGQPLMWQPHVLEQKPDLCNYFLPHFASRREDGDIHEHA